MTTTYALANSALGPVDLAPMFTDSATYLSMTGATIKTRALLGTRYYFLATVAITDDVGSGWTSTKDVILHALNDGFAAVAPSVVTAPSVKGTREVGKVLMCIGGRCDGWVSPYWQYQWLRDGVEIDGATRWVYTLTSADLGAAVECQQTWTNVGGAVSSTSSGGAATAAAAAAAPVGTVRYVGPTSAGTGAGTSWANRMGISSISLAISQAGPGGEVLLGADLGVFLPNDTAIYDGGTDDTHRVTIRGVNTMTGADQVAVMGGGRSEFSDVGRYMSRTGSSGNSAFKFLPPTTTFTVNTGTEVLTVNSTIGTALETDDPVWVSSTGTLPSPLAATTTYYWIAVTATTGKLSLTAGGAAIDLTTAGTGTHTILAVGRSTTLTADAATNQLTVSDAFYADTFDGDVVRALSNGGTLPGGLVHAEFYVVKKISANVIKLAGGTINLRNAAYQDILDAGSGAFIIQRQQPQRGPNYMTWKNIYMSLFGGSGTFILGISNRGNTFEDIYARNVYRLFDCTHNSAATSGVDCSIYDFTMKYCHVFGVERSFLRLRYGSRNGLVQDCSSDSARYFKDPFASQFALESTNSSTSAFNGPCSIHYLRCMAKRSYQDAGSGQYWNGDGFEDNQASVANHYESCESSWNSDGGFDCKGTDDLFDDCLAAFNKRNFRIWGIGVILNNCWSMQPQRAGEAFGENGGSLHFWQGRDNSTVTINDPVVREGGNTTVYYQDDYTGLVMTVNQTDYIGRTATAPTRVHGTMVINP